MTTCSHNWERKEGIASACKETRKVAAEEVLSALFVIKKTKIDPSSFLETLGGKESPGRTWMLIFTAETLSTSRKPPRANGHVVGLLMGDKKETPLGLATQSAHPGTIYYISR